MLQRRRATATGLTLIATILVALAAAALFQNPAVGAASSGPAAAQPGRQHPCEHVDPCNVATNYTVLRTLWSPPLHRCIGFQMQGQLSYRRTDYWLDSSWPGPSDRNYDHIKITAPSMRVWTYNNCTDLSYRRVTKATLRQDFHHETCSLNGDISVSFPWGIAVNPGYGCNGSDQAVHTTTYGAAGHGFWQANSSQVISWGGIDSRHLVHPAQPLMCVVIRFSAVVYRGGTSDSVQSSGRICPLN